jgi:hypothetical protein
MREFFFLLPNGRGFRVAAWSPNDARLKARRDHLVAPKGTQVLEIKRQREPSPEYARCLDQAAADCESGVNIYERAA